MQDTLLGLEFDAPVIGAPVSVADTQKIIGQQARVEAIMAAGYWHTIPTLQRELKRRFSTLYSETSISARIRAARKRGWHVECRRTRPGSGLYEYRITKAAAMTTLSTEVAA